MRVFIFVTYLQKNAMTAGGDMQQLLQLMFNQVCDVHQSAAYSNCQLGWHLKSCRLCTIVDQAQLSTHLNSGGQYVRRSQA